VTALAFLVLLAACANLASLFAARAAESQPGNWRSVSPWERAGGGWYGNSLLRQ